ncbi:Uncharacterised protein [Bordetella pertussis]|nr:Uncharacterised protein [Bordetella pertussis]CFP60426.1 Uncharacterised protein [Bordetella pertussis]
MLPVSFSKLAATRRIGSASLVATATRTSPAEAWPASKAAASSAAPGMRGYSMVVPADGPCVAENE